MILNLSFTGHYAGHSFCRGAATWAKDMSFTKYEIQLLGRWESDTRLFYIDNSFAVILNASRRQLR